MLSIPIPGAKPKRLRHVWCVDYQREDGEWKIRICSSKAVARRVLDRLRKAGHAEAQIADEWR